MSMRKWLLLLAIGLVGCMGGGDSIGPQETDGIRPGLYENRINMTYSGTFLELVGQAQFRADRTYSASMYIDNIPLMEAKGRWAQSASTLTYTEVVRREVNEDGSWGPWQAVPDGTDQIRNITSTSYQYYFDFEESFTVEQRQLIEGVSSGWYTYNRISD